ncbi:MAG: hypothetical protein KGI50_07010 [Patescibacteria group bacterium]|nr:hypothetical protein [Patescibacteria group bacterium]MDE2439226.1 hypothetical protein [Patescibacteria group bacterium]
MSNDLITIDPEQQVSIYDDDAAFLALSKTANSFLPRLQLFGAASGIVKEGKFPMSHWGLVTGKDEVTDLGKEVTVIPISVRFKAMDLSSGDILNYYNPNTPEFKSVQERSLEKDSQCMAGNEFLIWVPDCKSFATFYASNTSSKQEAPKIRALTGKAATFKSKFVKAKNGNSWHAPVVMPCSDSVTNLPSQEAVSATVEDFRNPKDSEVTVAEGTNTGGRVQ